MKAYLFVTPALDWDDNEIPIHLSDYDITLTSIIHQDTENHEYIIEVEYEDEEKFNQFMESHINLVRYATDKEVIDCFRDEKMHQFDEYHREYIKRHYPPERQISFLSFVNLYSNVPEIVEKVNQVKYYIFDIIMPYYYQICEKIKTCDNLEEWNNITWDYNQFEEYNPHLRVQDLVEIVQNYQT